jgi:hypothetical protein
MYNGQFAKALAHVLIFAVFVSLANSSSIFGILVAGWVVYQVFDAYHTAKARLYGSPLPNPFGLNDLGSHWGLPHTPPPVSPGSAFTPGNPPQSPPVSPADAASPVTPPYSPPAAYGMPESFAASSNYRNPSGKSKTPAGAVVLIAIGLFLLFQTLGIFRAEWVDRGWPLLIVGLGVWLLYRRAHETPGGGS